MANTFFNGSPALSDERFAKYESTVGESSMTVAGTINKALILFVLMMIPAVYVYNQTSVAVDASGYSQVSMSPLTWVGLIGGLIAALVCIFAPKTSPFSAPFYAVFEGMLLGGISGVVGAQYEGIVSQAIFLTFGVLLVMLGLYKGGYLRATAKFTRVVIIMTISIGFVYLLSFILSFFGTTIPMIHENGLIGIGFSLFVVVVAALNLILDFDMIEKGTEHGAPRYMEWYSAFGIMVTLVWLYINILRLLSKIASRD